MIEIRVGLILEPPVFDQLDLSTHVLLSTKEQKSTIELSTQLKKENQ
jgi:hypothetical protein